MVYENRVVTPIEEKSKKTSGNLFDLKDVDMSILETIAYDYPKRKIKVEMTTNEFTCVCPFSGLPDFALITIEYVPRTKLVEMKSLKYYLYSFRNVKGYNEHVVNKIIEDLTKVLKPYEINVVAEFTVRGGIKNKVSAQYKAK
ncbi:MAG: preQ(1) synthase [Candidatus Omnitrophica bacterium]|nr:preQ(1) synthase [Candidatus Omnitrophota bacterium]